MKTEKGKIKDFTKLLETQKESNLKGILKIKSTRLVNKDKYYLVEGKNKIEYYINSNNLKIIK
tara:strand:+ start:421 stop:609 length:189 start_codon:yes stop_codon:yes gene_type:complete